MTRTLADYAGEKRHSVHNKAARGSGHPRPEEGLNGLVRQTIGWERNGFANATESQAVP